MLFRFKGFKGFKVASALLAPALLLAGCAPSTSFSSSTSLSQEPIDSTPETSSGQPSESLFETHCLVCHSTGSMRGMDVLVKRSPKFASEQAFLKYLRHPGLGMPTFGPEQLSDADIQQLYVSLKKDFGAH